MPLTEKNEHISTVIPIQIYNTLKQASEIMGETLSQFLVQAAFEKARTIIEDERVINLSMRDADKFFQAIDNPPQASDKLSKAMKAYKDAFLKPPICSALPQMRNGCFGHWNGSDRDRGNLSRLNL